MVTENEIATPIRSYSQKELRVLYGDKTPISWETFSAWIDPFKNLIGELKGRKYTPRQVAIIFEKVGNPYKSLT